MITNKEFMRDLEEDYPDTDWDNLPDLKSAPDEFVIKGMMHRRMHFSDKDIKDTIGFGEIRCSSQEEAEAELEKMKNNPCWCEEHVFDDQSSDPLPHIEYHGPVVWNTVQIFKTKPEKLTTLHLMKSLRDQVLAGESVFPMYLP